MNRFLRNEWQQTEIPERAYLQARNRAWDRLRGGTPAARPALMWAASIACAVIAVTLFFWQREIPRIEPSRGLPHTEDPKLVQALQSKPVREIKSRQNVSTPNGNLAANQSPRKRASGKSAGTAKRTQTGAPEHVVLNFVLPESGVRMIWISDKNFKLDGANE